MDFEREGACAICHSDLGHDQGVYSICSSPGCESVTHLTCLSSHFLAGEMSDVLVPIKGHCPSCKTEQKWVDVATEVTLRMRGQKEVEKLLKVKRVRKGKVTASQALIEDDDDEEEEEDEDIEVLAIGGPERKELSDEWGAMGGDSDSDLDSVFSAVSASSQVRKTTPKGKGKAMPTVIEDSDFEDGLW